MLAAPHPLDPNFIDFGLNYEHVIYGLVPPSLRHFTDKADDYVEAWVDAEDYCYFSQWTWQVKYCRHGRKPYLYRKVWDPVNRTKNRSEFLHVAIWDRQGIDRPPFHTMTDHRDGDSLHCRKHNLRPATPSMNRRNLYGQGDLI